MIYKEEDKLNNIHGWLFIDKPAGISSFQELNKIKRILNKKIKVGHGGTLDPLAEGVLPIAIGEGTKILEFVLTGDKEYIFTMEIGKKTSTGDLSGVIVDSNDFFPSKEAFESVMSIFIGEITQTPPRYSAIKINGKRAYELARQGIDFEIKSRKIRVYNLCLINYNIKTKQVTLKAKVSKGTYIRTLAEDIAIKLGSLSHIVFLRRTKVFLSKEISLISLNKSDNIRSIIVDNLVSIEDMLDDILAYSLNKQEAISLLNGNIQPLRNKIFKIGKIRALYHNKIIALLEKTEYDLLILKVFNVHKNHLI